ncbi:ABC transporter substrate-binding protein [Burkholderiaceae bacterium DAT-1]|nr:ABC transporter substrate-binding protein [Burkholderiaceae bacterium DAT-1]
MRTLALILHTQQLIVLACLLACLSTSVQAACTRAYQPVMMPLGLAMIDNGTDQLSGFMPDIYRELAQRSGCSLKVISQPSGRMLAIKAHNPLIGPTFVTPTPKGQKLIYIPFMHDVMQLVVHKDRADHFNLHSFISNGGIIGVLRGANYGKWGSQFLATLSPAHKEQINSIDSIYRMLEANRIHATFANTYVFYFQRRQMAHPEHYTLVTIPEEADTVYSLRFNLDVIAPEDADLLMRTFESMRDEGRVCAIMEHYFERPVAQKMCSGMEHGKRVIVE